MKIKILTVFLSLLFATTLSAQDERVSVALKLPDDFFAKTCPVAIWKDTKVEFLNVSDIRDVREVGRQNASGGKNTVLMDAAPALNFATAEALKRLFTACGLTVVEGGAAKPDVFVGVDIKEFYVAVEKKLVTGKGAATAQIALTVRRAASNSDQTIEVGYEIDDKSIRRKDVRQLEKVLNELFAGLLAQIPKTAAFTAAIGG